MLRLSGRDALRIAAPGDERTRRFGIGNFNVPRESAALGVD